MQSTVDLIIHFRLGLVLEANGDPSPRADIFVGDDLLAATLPLVHDLLHCALIHFLFLSGRPQNGAESELHVHHCGRGARFALLTCSANLRFMRDDVLGLPQHRVLRLDDPDVPAQILGQHVRHPHTVDHGD